MLYEVITRAVRDLLRRRSRLVQQHTANLLAIQNLFARDRGRSLSANEVKRLTPETVNRLLPDPNQALAVQATLLPMRGQEAAIDLLEREALAQVRLRPAYRHLLSVSGIGQVLGLTIMLVITSYSIHYTKLYEERPVGLSERYCARCRAPVCHTCFSS